MIHSQLLLDQAKAALQANRRDEARQLLMQAVRADPNNGAAWYLLGQVIDHPVRREECEQRARAAGYNPPAPDHQDVVRIPAPPFSPSPSPEPPAQASQGRPTPTYVQGLAQTEDQLISQDPRAYKPKEKRSLRPIGLAAGMLAFVIIAIGGIYLWRNQRAPATESSIEPSPPAAPMETPSSAFNLQADTRMAFVKLQPGGQGGVSELNIVVSTLDGWEADTITNMPGIETEPTWSPDGESIAFVATVDSRDPSDCSSGYVDLKCDFNIYIADSDGANLRRLTTSTGYERGPAWSPDGTKLVYSSGLRPEGRGHTHIYMINADGTNETLLTDDNTSYGSPTWSPDGQRIALSRFSSTTGEICIMNADGSGMTQITAGNGDLIYARSQWSPDGQYLAVLAGAPGSGTGSLIVMKPDGSEQQLLDLAVPPSLGYTPSWSPDGQYLTFVAFTNRFSIYTVKADGSDLQGFNSGIGRASSPNWSPPLTNPPDLIPVPSTPTPVATVAKKEPVRVVAAGVGQQQSEVVIAFTITNPNSDFAATNIKYGVSMMGVGNEEVGWFEATLDLVSAQQTTGMVNQHIEVPPGTVVLNASVVILSNDWVSADGLEAAPITLDGQLTDPSGKVVAVSHSGDLAEAAQIIVIAFSPDGRIIGGGSAPYSSVQDPASIQVSLTLSQPLASFKVYVHAPNILKPQPNASPGPLPTEDPIPPTLAPTSMPSPTAPLPGADPLPPISAELGVPAPPNSIVLPDDDIAHQEYMAKTNGPIVDALRKKNQEIIADPIYISNDTIATIRVFYEAEMAGQGWALERKDEGPYGVLESYNRTVAGQYYDAAVVITLSERRDVVLVSVIIGKAQ